MAYVLSFLFVVSTTVCQTVFWFLFLCALVLVLTFYDGAESSVTAVACRVRFALLFLLQGGDLSKMTMAEINWDHVVTEPEHLKELKAYCCDQCGYTLFPARGTATALHYSGVPVLHCPLSII